MSDDERLDAGGELAAYQALFLMPGAPQELIVETYWHLVQSIMAGSPTDKDAQASLDALNRAYAVVSRPEVALRPIDAQADKPKRQALRHKLLKRNKPQPSTRSPWDILQVQPSAPQAVVDIAYRFWQVRLRNAWYDAAGTQRESLDEAYASLRRSPPSIPTSGSPQLKNAPASEPVLDGTSRPVGPSPSSVDTSPGIEAPRYEAPQPADSASKPVPAPAPRTTVAVDLEPALDDEPTPPAPTPIRPRPSRRHVAAGEPSAVANVTSLPAVEQEPSLAGQPAAQAAPTAESISAPAASTAPAPDPLAQALRNSPVPAVLPLKPEIDTAPVRPDDTAPQAAPRPHLVFESGSAAGRNPHVEIHETPVHIVIEDGFVDVSPAEGPGALARVWALGQRVMFHALTSESACRINGRVVTWAVLEDGDTIQVGADLIRFFQEG